MEKKKKILKIFLVLFLFTASFLFIQTIFAQELGINAVGEEITLPGEDPRIIAARIIRAALGFLGIIALIIVLYGGFAWMTSAGNEERIAKAKKILTNGLIGLIIIVFSFGITQFVLNKLIEVTGVLGPGIPGGPSVVEQLSSSLGNGIIESHWPARGATGVSRNTKIIVTFRESVTRESIITNYNDNGTPDNLADDWGGLNSENVKIYKSIDGEINALADNQVKVMFTSDLKTFVFDPDDLLGSPSENIWYTVALKPGIRKSDGSDAFVGAFRGGYLWDFEVSTFVDTTPPQVESVWPNEGDTVARNALIQINFDEAMDPTTVTGEWPTFFDKIEVKKADGSPISGRWSIANQYKTVEFITNDKCGTNSCGGDVFCLPGDERIDVLILAATLSESPPEALWPYDGVTDAAGNSLDGNKDGTAQGSDLDEISGVDNFGLSFSTNNTIDLAPPEIENVSPSPNTSGAAFNVPVEMFFSKIMSIGSFNSENIILEDNQRDECAVWFYLGGINLKEDGTPVDSPDDVAAKTKAAIYHGNFIPTGGTCADGNLVSPETVMYYPRVTHGVKDVYQNCFFEPEGPGGGKKCIVGPDGNLPPGCEPWK